MLKLARRDFPPRPAFSSSLKERGNAEFSEFKRAEDGNGYILRLRETAGVDGVVRLRSPLFRILRAFVTDGVEENQSPLPVKAEAIEIPLKTNRFSTVRLIFDEATAASK